MGAVAGNTIIDSALRYTKKNDNVNMAVYDSPFSSLRQLAIEIGKEKTRFPKFLIQLFLDYVKPIIAEKAKFNIDDLDITKDMDKIKVPGIFIGSMRDQLVPFRQVEELFQLYRSKKEMFLIEEEHNEPRSKTSIEKVFKSIKKHINATEHEVIHMQT
jgi:esterase/lipase